MSSVLHHLTSPVLLDAPVCGPAAAQASAGAPWLWPLAAAVLALTAALLGVWLLKRQGRRAWMPPRWAALGLLAALLLALPLLSLHLTHDLDNHTGAHCALAGIAHGVTHAMAVAAPALAVFTAALLLLSAPAPRPVHRAAPLPIARGPPVTPSLA